jgi:Flp pilus assembly pilin Flp
MPSTPISNAIFEALSHRASGDRAIWLGTASPSADESSCETSLGRPDTSRRCARRLRFQTSGEDEIKMLQKASVRCLSRGACLWRPFERQEGQTFVEYAMILAIVAIFIVTALTFFRGELDSAYSAVANAI